MTRDQTDTATLKANTKCMLSSIIGDCMRNFNRRITMRSIENAIKEYNERFASKNIGLFYEPDILQIVSMSKEEYQGRIDPYDIACKALEAGFAIGYRSAERHSKKS